jgi:hypothetical protein
MGTMSASDAAPLPRLGEVYFDVRGNSRTMRLSWYSDTGVAVFSIWQGGTCTGTFRLSIEDLPRMIEALQQGPGGVPDPAPAPRHPAAGRRDLELPAPQAGDSGPGMTSVADFVTARFPGPADPGDPVGHAGSAAAGFRPGYSGEPAAAFRDAPPDREVPADLAPRYPWEPPPRGRHRGNRPPAYPDVPPSGYRDGPVPPSYGDERGDRSAFGEYGAFAEYGIPGEHRARHGRL